VPRDDAADLVDRRFTDEGITALSADDLAVAMLSSRPEGSRAGVELMDEDGSRYPPTAPQCLPKSSLETGRGYRPPTRIADCSV